MDDQIIAKQFTRVPRRPQSVAKDGFKEQVLKTIGGQHFAKTLDISPVSIEYGTVTLKMPVQPKVFQQLGYVHGGAITALLDTATGMCSVTLLGPDETALTSELKVNFLGPGEGEYILATARTIKDGGKLLIMEAEATAVFADGRTRDVAHLTTTYIRIPRPPKNTA